MKFYELLTFLILWTIAVISGLVAFEFHRSIGNNRLRRLMRNLFISKVLVYGGAAVLFTIYNRPLFVYMRLILIIPMYVVMVQLWGYMRKR